MRYVAAIVALLVGSWLAAGEPPAVPKQFSSGRKVHEVRCGKCHEPPQPGQYAEKEWREWFVKMSRQAKLNASQADALQQYTDWLRAQKPPEKK